MDQDVCIIEATPTTPYVSCDTAERSIKIRGRAIPENSTEFFHPVRCWIDAYKKLNLPLRIDFQFEYFNTAVLKNVVKLLKSLEELYSAGTEVTINWYYETDDEDMLDEGQNLADIVKIPIHLIQG
ncbi:MAG: DUF1987 domain-containing protein [Bacteroidales bacterium]|jgi:hypothetical protein|nr:DUF1987 domain-containing protein [Bacteroidales bacterium]